MSRFIIQTMILVWFCVGYGKQQLKWTETEGERSHYINQKQGTHKTCHFIQQKLEDQKRFFLRVRGRGTRVNLYNRAANRAP